MRDPQVYVRPVVYRPIRVYVGGEIKRPGYYTLSGSSVDQISCEPAQASSHRRDDGIGATEQTSVSGGSTSATVFPTVFDAIRSAQGITPYTDLSKVEVIRKRAEGLGGGRIKTNLNFLSLITEGNESQNIRLFDGDALNVGKSSIVLQEQLLKVGQTNLSPQFQSVCDRPRQHSWWSKDSQGSSLNQAISQLAAQNS